MLLAAVALLAVLQTSPAPASADLVFSQACVSTRGDRQKLADLARASGWSATPPPADQVSQPNLWADAWSVDGVTVFLVSYAAGSTGEPGAPVRFNYPASTICGTTGPASPEWRESLTRDAETLALSRPRISILRRAEDDHQSVSWGTLFDGLDGEYYRSTNRLEVRRPFPAPASSAQ